MPPEFAGAEVFAHEDKINSDKVARSESERKKLKIFLSLLIVVSFLNSVGLLKGENR